MAIESNGGADNVLPLPVDGLLPLDGRWYKPRASMDNGTCLMARFMDGKVEIGSTIRSGVVSLDIGEWQAFVTDVENGAYRLGSGDRQ